MANYHHILEIEPEIKANCDAAAILADALLADQPELSKKVRRALLCSSSEARQGIIEAIKFIWLAAESSSGRLTPAHRVDLAWHELILFTRTYEQFCDEHFGKFVHHQPEGLDQENEQQFSRTLSRYREVFGVPPQDFWGTWDDTKTKANSKTPDCGTCESKQ